MGQVANGPDLGHACAAFEGVQIPLQRRQRCRAVGLQQPAFKRLPGAVEDIHRLFQEDLDNLVVHRRVLAQLCRGGAQFRDAQGAAAVAFDQAGGGRVEGVIEQFAQRLYPRRRRADFLAGGQLVEHVDQRFMGLFGLMEKPLADRQAAFFHGTIQIEQGLAQRVNRVQVGDVRAFTQGGQFVQQRGQFLTLAGVLLPTAQQAFGIQQDVHALGQEVGNQLRVALDTQARVGRVEQGFELLVKQALGTADQVWRTLDRHERITVQLTQPALKQTFRFQQQLHFIQVQRQAVGLVFAGQVIKRPCQFGNWQYAGHVGTALEGVQGALQFIADLQRHVFGGLLQEVVEAFQVALGFVAKNLQQHRVVGFCGRYSAAGQRVGTRGQGVDFIALALVISGEVGNQFRQQGHGVIQHLLNIGAEGNAAFEHAVKQVFQRPGQLGQHQGADHTAAAFQGVKRAAHLSLGGFVRAVRQVTVQHFEDFVGFFKEDFAQLVVDGFLTVRRWLQAARAFQCRRVQA